MRILALAEKYRKDNEMIEMRWLYKGGRDVLQYRQMANFVRSHVNEEAEWGEWTDVPKAKEGE